MTLSRVDLESFDDGSTPQPKESIEYLRGFEAGTLAAQSSETAKLARATEAMSAKLSDMSFGYAEARVHILERTRPLLTQIADLILPALAQEVFSAHLVDVLQDAFEEVTDQPIQIAAHPKSITHLTEKLFEHEKDFIFLEDAKLAEGQALLRHDHTQTLIDLPALLSALQKALNGLEPLERNLSNG